MKLVIIGSGRVASSLGTAFKEAGHTILQVAGRSDRPVKSLARKLGAAPVIFPDRVSGNADFYIIAVKDDAVENTAAYLQGVSGTVIHTSGSVPVTVLTKYHHDAGVFWPLDTFGSKPHASLNDVPLCIEASSEKVRRKLKRLASTISKGVYDFDSTQRGQLHLAAVFANNFTNHLNALSFAILENHNISRKLLYKLIRSTAENAINPGPEMSQTGPAARNDKATIAIHKKLLKKDPSLKKLYDSLTKDIIQHQALKPKTKS
jgi:predicted short-subunit dehydrogenase-like oxidoreductase (DUF2520 family)